ncbi:MAG: hypothetical protein WAL64_09480 [Candidatus Dormiibacterota bacterium]
MVTGRPPATSRQLPPITGVLVLSMAMVIAGGIYLAAYLPKQAPLPLPIALVTVGVVLFVVAALMLTRLGEFAWERFFQVGGWALLAYVVIVGMLELVLVIDQTRGALLALLTVILLIFALDIPLLLGFSVARFQETASPPTS